MNTDTGTDTEWNDFLREALSAHDIELVREALERGADPNLDIHGDGSTALYWAAFAGRLDEAQALLEAGAKVAYRDYPDAQPLHTAVEDGSIPMVKLFLAADGAAALDWFDYISRTPLMCAVRGDNLPMARLLIAAGADVNAHDEKNIGDTALHDAAKRGLFAMAELLVEAGADPTIKGWMWITPLSAAQERKKPEGRKLAALLEAAAKARK